MPMHSIAFPFMRTSIAGFLAAASWAQDFAVDGIRVSTSSGGMLTGGSAMALGYGGTYNGWSVGTAGYIQAESQGVAYRPLLLQPRGAEVVIGTDPGGSSILRVGGGISAQKTSGTSQGDDLVLGNTSGYATGLRIYNSNYLANKYWLIGHDSLGGLSFNNNGADLLTLGRSGSDAMVFSGSKAIFYGNVGIGVNNPTATLSLPNSGNATLRVGISDNRSNAVAQVLGSLATTASDSSSAAEIIAGDVNYFNNGNSSTFAGSVIRYFGSTAAGNIFGQNVYPVAAGTALFSGQNAARLAIGVNSTNPIHFFNGTGTCILITGAGNVGIGVANPTSKLAVNGIISAAEVKVTANPADYVFTDGYVLRPLAEVEHHVKADHHLPGVPSAQQQQDDGGTNLSDMQRIHLEKIEELTLYAIAADKRLAAAEARMAITEAQCAEKDREVLRLSSRLARIELALGASAPASAPVPAAR